MSAAAPHEPVLLAEALAALAPIAGRRVVDATFGAGGYSRALLAAGASVIAIDRDPAALARAEALRADAPDRFRFVEGRFGALERHLDALGVRSVDAVVFDLGVSSMQLDTAERGFSFRRDGPLDMRMGGNGPSAADLLASLPEAALADILYRYGEEHRSRAVARALVARRAEAPFTRTRDLAEVVGRVVGRSPKDRSDPATRSFQALRIAVNREFEEIAAGLGAAEHRLVPGGRLAVVSFHSLEDRIVKSFLAERGRAGGSGGSRHAPAAAAGPEPSFEPALRRSTAPSEAERARNPRARSARLRAACRTAAPSHPLDLDALGVVPLDALTARGGRR